MTYDKAITGLLVIDPYNDISEGGKVWDRLKGVAEANDCVPHMAEVLGAAQGGDIVAQEHWCSIGFANTDLDLLLAARRP
jgi:hypothetical protein